MGTRRHPNWRTIADSLAQRLQHHLCQGHPESECDPDDPWCRNRAAYRMWDQKKESGR